MDHIKYLGNRNQTKAPFNLEKFITNYNELIWKYAKNNPHQSVFTSENSTSAQSKHKPVLYRQADHVDSGPVRISVYPSQPIQFAPPL